jgi:hypothetical protein
MDHMEPMNRTHLKSRIKRNWKTLREENDMKMNTFLATQTSSYKLRIGPFYIEIGRVLNEWKTIEEVIKAIKK